MKTVYVLSSKRPDYGPRRGDPPHIIGVFDCVGEANLGMAKYFGSYNLIDMQDVRDGGIEFVKLIGVDGDVYSVSLMYFNINEV